jgi:uncharacterized low-complexity protein
MKKTFKTPFAVTVGAAVISSFAATVAQAEANPFGMTELSSGYMQVAEMKCGANMKMPAAAAPATKMSEGTCAGSKTAAKAKEGGCGEGKCGAMMKDGKMKEGMEKVCGAMMKGKEGACGAAKAAADAAAAAPAAVEPAAIPAAPAAVPAAPEAK